jgi:hypothetical protein
MVQTTSKCSRQGVRCLGWRSAEHATRLTLASQCLRGRRMARIERQGAGFRTRLGHGVRFPLGPPCSPSGRRGAPLLCRRRRGASRSRQTDPAPDPDARGVDLGFRHVQLHRHHEHGPLTVPTGRSQPRHPSVEGSPVMNDDRQEKTGRPNNRLQLTRSARARAATRRPRS